MFKKFLAINGLFFLVTNCGEAPSQTPRSIAMHGDERNSLVVWPSAKEKSSGEVKPRSYLVGFRAYARDSHFFRDFQNEHQNHSQALFDIGIRDSGIKNINFIGALDLKYSFDTESFPVKTFFKEPTLIPLQISFAEDDPLVASLCEVDFSTDEDALRILSEWAEKGRIYYAEPNYANNLHGIWGDFQQSYQAKITSQNSSFSLHQNINSPGAYAALDAIPTATDDEPIIAVMDSGVDVTHPAIKSRIWVNDDTSGAAGCGTNDINGCNTTTVRPGFLGDGDVFPAKTSGPGQTCPSSAMSAQSCDRECCHGTHVAGIIAAPPNDSFAGVCPICRIMVIRVVGEAPSDQGGNAKYTTLDSWIAAGLKYVSRFREGSPVRVINTSFGKFQRSRTIARLIATLARSSKNSGTLVIGSAGNEDSLKMQFPAGYSDALAVSNLTSSKLKNSTSSFGQWVDVSAPGTQIISSVPGGSTEPKTGTSMSAPVVSGLAGLLLAANPDISVEKLRQTIINTADPTIYSNGVNVFYLVQVPNESTSIPLLGSGIVNAEAAVKGTNSSGQPAAVPLDRVGPGCGVIGSTPDNSVNHFDPLIRAWILLLPLLFLFLSHSGFFLKRLHRKEIALRSAQ